MRGKWSEEELSKLPSLDELHRQRNYLETVLLTHPVFHGFCLRRAFNSVQACRQAANNASADSSYVRDYLNCSRFTSEYVNQSNTPNSACVNYGFQLAHSVCFPSYAQLLQCMQQNEGVVGRCVLQVNALHQCLERQFTSVGSAQWTPATEQQWKEDPNRYKNDSSSLEEAAASAISRAKHFRLLTDEQREELGELSRKFRDQVHHVMRETAPETKEQLEQAFHQLKSHSAQFYEENKERLDSLFTQLQEQGAELIHTAEETMGSAKEKASASLHVAQEKASESLHVAQEKASESLHVAQEKASDLKEAAADAVDNLSDSTDKE